MGFVSVTRREELARGRGEERGGGGSVLFRSEPPVRICGLGQ